ncbi:hypothetical protein DFH09DRAFT_1372527 [Mycena vulgaris]|nr:hypothetical protein DFH09DRAFT_1372527 [Mycena vulgaris]
MVSDGVFDTPRADGIHLYPYLLCRPEIRHDPRCKDDDLEELTARGSAQPAVSPTTDGWHINFFEDLEHNSIAMAGYWYDEEDRARGDRPGIPACPLRKGSQALVLNALRISTKSSWMRNALRPNASRPPELQARLTCESSECERALELVRRKQREMRGSEPPSTVHGSGYGDLFNHHEVEGMHRGRDRAKMDFTRCEIDLYNKPAWYAPRVNPASKFQFSSSPFQTLWAISFLTIDSIQQGIEAAYAPRFAEMRQAAAVAAAA